MCEIDDDKLLSCQKSSSKATQASLIGDLISMLMSNSIFLPQIVSLRNIQLI